MTTMTIGTDRLDSVMRSQTRLAFANIMFTMGTLGALLLGTLSMF